MILPIIAYGDPVLRQKGKQIPSDYVSLKELIANMFETMKFANGVGLAAQQVGLALRLFIIDSEDLIRTESEETDETEDEIPIKKVFINPEIIDRSKDSSVYNEGCLSIPEIREDVKRPVTITIAYYDEKFQYNEVTWGGLNARVIQHEYDHIEGVLFVDHVGQLKKRLLKKKLSAIGKGEVKVKYKMKYPKK